MTKISSISSNKQFKEQNVREESFRFVCTQLALVARVVGQVAVACIEHSVHTHTQGDSVRARSAHSNSLLVYSRVVSPCVLLNSTHTPPGVPRTPGAHVLSGYRSFFLLIYHLPSSPCSYFYDSQTSSEVRARRRRRLHRQRGRGRRWARRRDGANLKTSELRVSPPRHRRCRCRRRHHRCRRRCCALAHHVVGTPLRVMAHERSISFPLLLLHRLRR